MIVSDVECLADRSEHISAEFMIHRISIRTGSQCIPITAILRCSGDKSSIVGTCHRIRAASENPRTCEALRSGGSERCGKIADKEISRNDAKHSQIEMVRRLVRESMKAESAVQQVQLEFSCQMSGRARSTAASEPRALVRK